jgi:hypothetical protein
VATDFIGVASDALPWFLAVFVASTFFLGKVLHSCCAAYALSKKGTRSSFLWKKEEWGRGIYPPAVA